MFLIVVILDVKSTCEKIYVKIVKCLGNKQNEEQDGMFKFNHINNKI